MSYRLLAVLLLVVGNAAAHRVNLLVLPDGDSVRGHVYYADGTPVTGANVEVRTADGETIDTVTTDAEGRFVYTPAGEADLVFVVAMNDGHRAESAAVATQSPPTGQMPVTHGSDDALASTVQIQRVVQHALLPLREQLDTYQREIRIRDVIGGIGYIVGVLGLIAWFKARQSGRAQ